MNDISGPCLGQAVWTGAEWRAILESTGWGYQARPNVEAIQLQPVLEPGLQRSTLPSPEGHPTLSDQGNLGGEVWRLWWTLTGSAPAVEALTFEPWFCLTSLLASVSPPTNKFCLSHPLYLELWMTTLLPLPVHGKGMPCRHRELPWLSQDYCATASHGCPYGASQTPTGFVESGLWP
jgi:hypothetical protein